MSENNDNGYIECKMKLNFGNNAAQNTKVKIKINWPDMDIHKVASMILFPALVGIGYQPESIRKVLKYED